MKKKQVCICKTIERFRNPDAHKQLNYHITSISKLCCTCKTSIKQELTVLFNKSWEIKKTNKQQLDLCDYTESFIESVPIVFYTFQWKATRSFLNIQQMILSWKEQLVKKRTVWLMNEYSCTLYELKVPLTEIFCSVT